MFKLITLLPLLLLGCSRCNNNDVHSDDSPSSDSDSSSLTDSDADGYLNDIDCDDNNSLVYPGAIEELCDSIDNDCDGETDEGRASEDTCDGIDNDCDGMYDEDEQALFRSTSGTTEDMSLLFQTGTADAPFFVQLSAPGELVLCGGAIWYLEILVSASISIIGVQGVDIPTISAGNKGTVLTFESDGSDSISASLSGVVVRDGFGTCDATPGFGSEEGGGICCRGPLSLDISDSIISANEATYGGGIASQDCSLTISHSRLEENYASAGGGLGANGGETFLQNVDVSLNEALTAGGGLFFASLETDEIPVVELSSTSIYQNKASAGGGMRIGDTHVTCIGSTDVSSGLYSNEAVDGGAVWMTYDDVGEALFEGVDCDLGATADGNDNSLPDIGSDEGFYASFDNDENFNCGVFSCNSE